MLLQNYKDKSFKIKVKYFFRFKILRKIIIELKLFIDQKSRNFICTTFIIKDLSIITNAQTVSDFLQHLRAEACRVFCRRLSI